MCSFAADCRLGQGQRWRHPPIWSGGMALAAGSPDRGGWCRLRSTRGWRPPPPRPLRRCFPAGFLENEADIKSLFPSKNNYIWDLILVDPRRQNHVQLDPVNPRLCAASIPCRTSPRQSCPVKLWKRSGRRVSRLMFSRYPSRPRPRCRSSYPPSVCRSRSDLGGRCGMGQLLPRAAVDLRGLPARLFQQPVT